MTIDLKDQRVLVIGAVGGVGEATARLFAAAGAKVTAAGRRSARLDAVAADIGSTAAPLDILDDSAIQAFFADCGPYHHVVIAAAATKSGPVAGLDLDDAKASMESKFWGAYRVARAAEILDGGSLTFVSGLSKRSSPTSVLQGAINAALEARARGLALEWAPVRVNTVSPGLIDTPVYDRMDAAARQAMFEKASARLPVGRVGQPEDIAQAILFVATNPYATGSTVTVDGGGPIA